MASIIDGACAVWLLEDMKIISTALTFILLAYSPAAFACSCIGGPDSVKELVDAADSIFIGYVEKVSENYETRRSLNDGKTRSKVPWKYNTLTFRAIKFYKGEEADVIEVERIANNSCNADFVPDILHVVAAKRYDSGVYTIDSCTTSSDIGVAMTRYFETGEDNFAPSKDVCYLQIKQVYDGRDLPGVKFKLDPVCKYHKAGYDRLYGKPEIEGK